MALSVYVHIPYCLQRCRYCDFTTFEQSEIMRPELYVDWILQEIRQRHSLWSDTEIRTVYFGGGTPSLLAPALIVSIYRELANVGFRLTPDCETTIEINPATLTESSLLGYVQAGFNRFSVGAQTFNDDLLKMCGRRHTAADTRETLRLLQKHQLNYSFDLLFALPGQTIKDLRADLLEVESFAPPHLSAYCLTVPESHPMALGRPPEDEQVAMFAEIEEHLGAINLHRYEISNFARPGFESRHNMSYWNDKSYWGIGLSSHSYLSTHSPYGLRFWNPKSLKDYGQQVSLGGGSFDRLLPAEQFEALALHESLTDYCHMFLRTKAGLAREALRNKYGQFIAALIDARLEKLARAELVEFKGDSVRLTNRGQLVSNTVFEDLTFLPDDVPVSTLTEMAAPTYCSV